MLRVITTVTPAGDPAGEDLRAPDRLLADVSSALAVDPDLVVVAINPHGLFAPTPAAVLLSGGRSLTGYTSGADFAVAGDLPVIIGLFETARRDGTSMGRVRLARDPGTVVTIRLFDMTPVYGVLLALVQIPEAAQVALVGGPESARPRVTTVRKDALAVVLEIDDAFSAILGWQPTDVIGHRSLDFVDPQDHERAVASWTAMVGRPGIGHRVRLRHRAADGSWRWFEVTNLSRLDDPDHLDVLAEMVDITEEMSAQEQLREREMLLRRLTQTLPVGVMQLDSRSTVVYRNQRLGQLLGQAHDDTAESQLAGLPADDRRAVQALLVEVLLGRGDQDLEAVARVPGNRPRRLNIALCGLVDATGATTGAIACVSDVTESVELREELADKAMYDGLTRAHSRSSILAILQDHIDRDPVGGIAVVFVDLDGFKLVNDRFGHEAGDVMLVEAAGRLRAGTRNGDVVGRLGGDEFLVVCPNVGSRSTARRIGSRLARQFVDQPALAGGATLRASIGVAWAESAPISLDVLVADADRAMYLSKRNGLGKAVMARSRG